MALTVLVSGATGYSSFFFERKRRHVILLLSLPVGARFVAWTKLFSAWATALSISLLSAIPSVIWGTLPSYGVWYLIVGTTGIIVASTLFATLLFRNEVLQQIPWATAFLVSGFSSDHWGTTLDWVATYPWTTLVLSLVVVVALTELAISILQRRDLDW